MQRKFLNFHSASSPLLPDMATHDLWIRRSQRWRRDGFRPTCKIGPTPDVRGTWCETGVAGLFPFCCGSQRWTWGCVFLHVLTFLIKLIYWLKFFTDCEGQAEDMGAKDHRPLLCLPMCQILYSVLKIGSFNLSS